MEANKIKINKINRNIQRLVAASLSIIIFGMSGGCVKNENNKKYSSKNSKSYTSASDLDINTVSMSDYRINWRHNIISDSDIIVSQIDLEKTISPISTTEHTIIAKRNNKTTRTTTYIAKKEEKIDIDYLISRSIIHSSAGYEGGFIAYQNIDTDQVYIVVDNKLKAIYPDVETFEDISVGDIMDGNYHDEKTVQLNLNNTKPATDPKRIDEIISHSAISNISDGVNTDKVTYYLNSEDNTLYLITNDKKRIIAKYPPEYAYYNKNNIQKGNKYSDDNAIFEKIISECELVLKGEDGTEVYENYDNYRVYVVINGKIVDEYQNSDEYNANNTHWDEGLDNYIYGGCRPRTSTTSTTSTNASNSKNSRTTTKKTTTTTSSTTSTQSKLDYIINNCDKHSSSSEYVTVYVDRETEVVYVVSNNGVIIEYSDVISYEGSLKADPIEADYGTTTETTSTTVFITTTTDNDKYVSDTDVKTLTKTK